MIYFFFFILVSMFGWGAALRFLSKFNKHVTIVKNWVHALHAFYFVVCYKMCSSHDWIDRSILGCIGFYTFDTLLLLHDSYKNGSMRKNAVFLIHHFIANYGLYTAYTDVTQQSIILHVYYLFEYSNFLLYVSYHIHKSYPDNLNAILVSECLQFIWYSYFRIIRFSYYFIRNFNFFLSLDFFLQFGVILLFFMGIFWSWSLFKKCAKGLLIKNDLSAQKTN